ARGAARARPGCGRKPAGWLSDSWPLQRASGSRMLFLLWIELGCTQPCRVRQMPARWLKYRWAELRRSAVKGINCHYVLPPILRIYELWHINVLMSDLGHDPKQIGNVIRRATGRSTNPNPGSA